MQPANASRTRFSTQEFTSTFFLLFRNTDILLLMGPPAAGFNLPGIRSLAASPEVLGGTTIFDLGGWFFHIVIFLFLLFRRACAGLCGFTRSVEFPGFDSVYHAPRKFMSPH
ncbi:hypothetical protein C8R43DRAFT_1027478 [Mycena crocata]|nr:hypothetical protein C8R43DRAFT_1027478 [Mycena crocata]